MRLFLRRHGDLILVGALILLFALRPQLDLRVVALFYEAGAGFPARHARWVQPIYYAFGYFWAVSVVLLALLVLSFLPRFRAVWEPRRKTIAYLLAVLLAGPGLLANTVLKDHWGRARPVKLVEFGGSAQYTPPLTPAAQCPRNCSFVSGHAAAAFYPMAGFWITRRRRWLAAGIVSGLAVGTLRIAAGAHFLSDVLFAGILVHFTCRVTAWLFGLTEQGSDDRTAAAAHPPP
jgi:lipid A 4'-phosphatase